ncbi:hypothetical protein QTN23_17470 [Pseudomonas shirazica]|uniref:hypothetical protein n=1 Tax=Pseudomonas shirazica TaxID=1940636 RepID=UPI0025AA05B0|nr:hypothetical protein [Pseudomonas shirazica]MDM9601310.1 hypothetical protein [Pseudomonas shirazica]MDO2414696.1 hypothetical protein [Pseudomonas shirazica]
MPVKAAAPALIVAALALVGDYTTLSLQSRAVEVREASATPPSSPDLRSVIAELTHGWLVLESIYSRRVIALMKSDTFDQTKYLKNAELLKAVRQLEGGLQAANVPTALYDEHQNLRRAVAKVRSKMVVIDGIYQQFFLTPDEFQSALSAPGLRDLADHTTRKLNRLA